MLLKNDGGLLPLAADDGAQTIAVIGEFARTPRYQGGGSSLITPTRLDDALTEITAATQATVSFSPGYLTGDTAAEEGVTEQDEAAEDQDLLAEAVAIAQASDVALVFVGSAGETEGSDRDGIDLPAAHLELIERVAAANPRTVVVLSNGGVLATRPWDGRRARDPGGLAARPGRRQRDRRRAVRRGQPVRPAGRDDPAQAR